MLKYFFHRKIAKAALFALLGFSVFAQGSGKRVIEMEEEIEDFSDEEEEQIITIEGEDEQIVRPKKKTPDFIKPTRIEKLKWIEFHHSVQKEGKSNKKETEKTGTASFLYAPLHTLLLNLDILKSDEHGKYKVTYERENREYIEQNNASVAKSAKESDKIDLESSFHLSGTYLFGVDLNYNRSSEELQDNTVYSSMQNKVLWGRIRNRFQLDNENRLDINLKSRYEVWEAKGSSNISQNRVDLLPEIKWEFINAKRFGVYARIFSFIENSDLTFSGGAESGLYIPLWNSLTGAKKLPWKGDLYAGGYAYYNASNQWIFGPKIRLSSLMGEWYSALEFSRNTRRLYENEDFTNLPYHHISELKFPEDYWEAKWTNSFPASTAVEIKMDAGYAYYNYSFESFSQDGIYGLRGVSYEDIFAAFFLRYNILENLFLETGFEIHSYSKAIQYVFPYWFPFSLVFEPGRWKLALDFSAGVNRKTETKNADNIYLLDMSIVRKIDPTISLEIRGQNLLDQEYLGMEPYQSKGRSIYAGVHFHF